MYRSWLKGNRSILDNAVLYIASDTDDAVAHFAEFGPVSSKDVGWGMPVLPYLPDWWVCGDADVLVVPNSTFSLTAAMLNEKAEQFLRVQRGRERLVPFDPWDTEVLIMEDGRSAWDRSRQRYLEMQSSRPPPPRGRWTYLRSVLRRISPWSRTGV